MRPRRRHLFRNRRNLRLPWHRRRRDGSDNGDGDDDDDDDDDSNKVEILVFVGMMIRSESNTHDEIKESTFNSLDDDEKVQFDIDSDAQF